MKKIILLITCLGLNVTYSQTCEIQGPMKNIYIKTTSDTKKYNDLDYPNKIISNSGFLCISKIELIDSMCAQILKSKIKNPEIIVYNFSDVQAGCHRVQYKITEKQLLSTFDSSYIIKPLDEVPGYIGIRFFIGERSLAKRDSMFNWGIGMFYDRYNGQFGKSIQLQMSQSSESDQNLNEIRVYNTVVLTTGLGIRTNVDFENPAVLHYLTFNSGVGISSEKKYGTEFEKSKISFAPLIYSRFSMTMLNNKFATELYLQIDKYFDDVIGEADRNLVILFGFGLSLNTIK